MNMEIIQSESEQASNGESKTFVGYCIEPLHRKVDCTKRSKLTNTNFPLNIFAMNTLFIKAPSCGCCSYLSILLTDVFSKYKFNVIKSRKYISSVSLGVFNEGYKSISFYLYNNIKSRKLVGENIFSSF